MTEQIRSFIAFDLDDEAILRRLSEAQNMLAKTGADLKFVEPKNIHMTMRFLGNISANMVDRIHGEMTKISFTPFEVVMKGVGAFPNVRRPRVVWAGIRKGAEELRNVFHQLEPLIQTLGFSPDPKGFSPHLTIARVKTGRNRTELVKCINELTNYEFGTVKAKCLRLKKSVLTPKGPIYSTLKEVCP